MMRCLLALFLLLAGPVHAACTNPGGQAGKIFFNTNYKVMEYCDGTQWINLGKSNPAGPLGNCTNPTGTPGRIIYNTNTHTLQYCNGSDWINLGRPNPNTPTDCTNPPAKPGQLFFNTANKKLQYCNGTGWVNTARWKVDTDPDPFNFTDLTQQARSTVVTSNIIRITGLGGLAQVVAGGAGSPQIRTCNDAVCASVITNWTTTATLANNKFLQARQTTSSAYSSTRSATIGIGSIGNTTWNVTTLDDTIPDTFSFTNLTDRSPTTVVTSNIIQITGINVSVTAATTGASSEIRTCADAACAGVLTTWGISMQIANGQYLQARQTTSGAGGTSTSATITVGGGNTLWSATTASTCALPWGGTLNDGQSVTAYSTTSPSAACSTVAQTRTCTAGTLSGSFTNQTCTNGCTGTPWGNVANGYSNTAYSTSTPTAACSSVAQTRTCINGTMSGSYTATSCTNGCTGTPWGNVASGYSNTAYSTSTPAASCSTVAETRTCTNGTLSGTYTNASCSNGCTGTPWGNVASGYSNTAYSTSTPAAACSSVAQTRTCTNGTMSGSFTNTSCTNGCTSTPWGNLYNGQQVTAYAASSVACGGTCSAETRTCSNGTLTGSYGATSCTPATCTWQNQATACWSPVPYNGPCPTDAALGVVCHPSWANKVCFKSNGTGGVCGAAYIPVYLKFTCL